MKKLIITPLIVFALLIASCSTDAAAPETTAPDAASTPTPLIAGYLPTEYEDAASARSQLALGTIKLEDSSLALSADQSSALMPLWQALLALESSDTTAPEEMTAVQNQIILGMNAEQLKAIAAMQLTNADLTLFYEQQGLVTVVSESTGTGQNSGLTPDEREAVRATSAALGTPVSESGGGGQDRKDSLTEAVIALMLEKTNR